MSVGLKRAAEARRNEDRERRSMERLRAEGRSRDGGSMEALIIFNVYE